MTTSTKKMAAQWGIGIATGVGAAMIGKLVMDNQSSAKKTIKRATKAMSHVMSNLGNML